MGKDFFYTATGNYQRLFGTINAYLRKCNLNWDSHQMNRKVFIRYAMFYLGFFSPELAERLIKNLSRILSHDCMNTSVCLT